MNTNDLFCSLAPVVLGQLQNCLRQLDAIGADMAAIHVDTAICFLREAGEQRGLQSIFEQTLVGDFSDLDLTIDSMYLPLTGSKDSGGE